MRLFIFGKLFEHSNLYIFISLYYYIIWIKKTWKQWLQWLQNVLIQYNILLSHIMNFLKNMSAERMCFWLSFKIEWKEKLNSIKYKVKSKHKHIWNKCRKIFYRQSYVWFKFCYCFDRRAWPSNNYYIYCFINLLIWTM